jgi:hypothetical protein
MVQQPMPPLPVEQPHPCRPYFSGPIPVQCNGGCAFGRWDASILVLCVIFMAGVHAVGLVIIVLAMLGGAFSR